jgi:hypothetical protein
MERHREAGVECVGHRSGGHNDHQQGVPHPHTSCSTVGCNRLGEEGHIHHLALPKLSFPKFSGENPRIWVGKCGDYFRIFNIPESM